MVSGIQLLGISFGLVLSYFTFLSWKRKEFSIKEFIGWELLWIGFVLVTLFPDKISEYSWSIGAIRPLDFFTIIGFIVVLSISFYTYVNLDRFRKQIEKAIRDLAIDSHKDK